MKTKWARAIATEVNSKNSSPSGSFRNSQKLIVSYFKSINNLGNKWGCDLV